MKRNIKAKIISSIIIVTLLLSSLLASPVLAADSYPLTTGDAEVADALSFLQAEQATDGSIGGFGESAWVLMAVAAAGEDPHDWKVDTNPSLVDYLAAQRYQLVELAARTPVPPRIKRV